MMKVIFRLSSIFEQALKWVMLLPENEPFLERLDRLRAVGQEIGWGVGDDITEVCWQWILSCVCRGSSAANIRAVRGQNSKRRVEDRSDAEEKSQW
jgi:hypothetical protein